MFKAEAETLNTPKLSHSMVWMIIRAEYVIENVRVGFGTDANTTKNV